MLEPRLVINECYILQERLGEDSFCELWRASSIYSATQFLLRFIKPLAGLESCLAGFRAHAMACYSITAPSVMDFIEVEAWTDRSFISSEYDGQRSLLDFYGGSPRLRLEYACRFIIELGQGLDTFHKRGIVYRCLNAENVLLTRTGEHIETIRVQKPGYAPLLGLLDLKDEGLVLENFGYMAPEAKGDQPVDRRADIYSLGVHLFRFIVGRLPYAKPGRARSGSVSLSYAARAFARRGVPAPVARIALKAMRKDPRQRYGECLELIAELRAYMDERRRELLARGEVDPVAELASLNMDKDRLDAAQAVKSLETADYFRAISEARKLEDSTAPVLLFPVDDFANLEELGKVEAAEAEGEEDDGKLSPEAYFEAALASVAREGVSKRINAPPPPPMPARPPQAKPVPPGPADEDFTLASPFGPTLGAPVLRRGQGSDSEASPEGPFEEGRYTKAAPNVEAFAADPGPARRVKRPAQAAVDAGGISWRPDSAPPLSVVEGMESAFTRSFKGTGAFRFIQEPPPGPDAVAFARIFARFRARGLVVDLGNLGPDADATDLLRALRVSLAEGLSYESPQSRAVLAKRLRGLDDVGAFKAAPLGSLLFKEDSPEPDPEWTDSTEGAMKLAVCLAALGRRRRPLVLSFRGAEVLGRSAHAVFVELARLSPIASLCCFAFYEPGPVPEWHVLSRLNKS